MYIEDQEFLIRGKNKAGALAAIKGLDPNGTDSSSARLQGGRWDGEKQAKVERWFSWVDTKEYQDAETLEDALRAWRWPSDPQGVEPTEDVDHIAFDGEKIGNEEVLFDAIAPFVESGSFIEMHGEDGCQWRWLFRNGKCYEIYPELTWPEPS
jgi:hypothetical protein